MRKVVAFAFISLDGVMQAPGGPAEDPTGGFGLGGWSQPVSDEVTGGAVGRLFEAPFELLLGRRTYDIFAAYWPFIPQDPGHPDYEPFSAAIARRFNGVKKHVATHRPESLTWDNAESLGEQPIARIRELKAHDGPALLTQGSTELLHLLFEHELVDELILQICPLVLGRGKRLFATGSAPAAFALRTSVTSPSGVIIAHYERAGQVPTGSFVRGEPSLAELERRGQLSVGSSPG